jgi:hypothetical protein
VCVYVYLHVSVPPKAIFLPSFTVFVHKCHFLILVGVFIVQHGKTRSSTSDKVENVQTKN